MIQNEKQLRKIIKENISKKLLKEFFGDGDDYDDDDFDLGGNDNYNVKIDDEIIQDASGQNAKRKNQLIIESILLLSDTKSSDFKNFFTKSFKKQTIDEAFLSSQEDKRESDHQKLTDIIETWRKTLTATENAKKDPAGAYKAANIVLKSTLDSFRPTWPVLWIFFRDCKKILPEIINTVRLSNNTNWETKTISDNFKIEIFNKSGSNSLKLALINYFNEKIVITENDINEIGSELEDTEGLDDVGNLIMNALQFFFGDEIKPVVREFMRSIKNEGKNLITTNSQQTKVDQTKMTEKIKQSEVGKKVSGGDAKNITKDELTALVQYIQQ